VRAVGPATRNEVTSSLTGIWVLVNTSYSWSTVVDMDAASVLKPLNTFANSRMLGWSPIFSCNVAS
jgi:hypothetical protein